MNRIINRRHPTKLSKYVKIQRLHDCHPFYHALYDGEKQNRTGEVEFGCNIKDYII